MLRILTAIGFAGVCSVALGAEVVESRFEVSFSQNGEDRSVADTTVPYLPGSACYNWYAKFDPATQTELSLTETLTLPEPLAAWQNYQNDPAAETQIAADAQSAITTLKVTPDGDGWVSHGWCVEDGDPLGPHNLSLTLDGATISDWDFVVVAAEDYVFEEPSADLPAAPDVPEPPPPPQPSPTARDVNQSW